mmetsp:Transcript_62478/g.167301  ORF Transcript_62478/g.167301 Transcript_62478/m.167301 type:complete len:114 (-) Transcript_62478:420-761(-)
MLDAALFITFNFLKSDCIGNVSVLHLKPLHDEVRETIAVLPVHCRTEERHPPTTSSLASPKSKKPALAAVCADTVHAATGVDRAAARAQCRCEGPENCPGSHWPETRKMRTAG